jgi:hypothetical protein
MCGGIRIRMKRAYFHGKHMDLMWYGRKGIMMSIKKDCGSFHQGIFKITILDWMWLGKFSWGISVYVTLKKKDEDMETSCTFIIVMEND